MEFQMRSGIWIVSSAAPSVIPPSTPASAYAAFVAGVTGSSSKTKQAMVFFCSRGKVAIDWHKAAHEAFLCVRVSLGETLFPVHAAIMSSEVEFTEGIHSLGPSLRR
jgi:hypothetical protein